MGFFEEEQNKVKSDYEEIRRKSFNGEPFLLYQRFVELDSILRSLYPSLDKINKYKPYFDAVTKYFSQEGEDEVMEFKDTHILDNFVSEELRMTFQMLPVEKKDTDLSKKTIYEFGLLSGYFNTISGLMYSDEDYEGARSYKQYLKDRQIEAEQEKQRIREESLQQSNVGNNKIMDKAESEQYCDAYSDMVIALANELKATNGFFTRDSKEYKALAARLQHEALLLRVGIPSVDSIKTSLSELTVLADAYIRHVPSKPDSRQIKRSDICKTIKAVAGFALDGVVDPKEGLEKMFIKTLVYNENPNCFSPENIKNTADRAADIYVTPSVKAELDKLSIVKLVAPSKKNLNAVVQTYDKARSAEKENAAEKTI